MTQLSEHKISIVNSFNDQWPNVWAFLFLDEPLQDLIESLAPLGVVEEEITGFRNDLRKLEPETLITMAKIDLSNNSPSPAIVVLNWLPAHEIVNVARILCHSDDVLDRHLGLLLIGNRRANCSNDEYERLICRLIMEEDAPEVISAGICALSNLHLQNTLSDVLRFIDHPSDDVREAVAVYVGDHDSPEAVSATLKLMKDPSKSVRSWASYLLASEISIEGPEVENALIEFANDSLMAAEDKAEVILGLARRKNPNTPDLINAALSDLPVCPGIFLAVVEMPSMEHLAGLENLRKNYTFSDYHTRLLDEAIQAVKEIIAE